MDGSHSFQAATIDLRSSLQSPVSSLSLLFENGGISSASTSGKATPYNDILSGFEQHNLASSSTSQPKENNRFTKEVVQILKRWLAAHRDCPYPTNEDMNMIQYQTKLNKTQIANWFANARRRGKTRKASRQDESIAIQPIDIVQRPGTPAPRHEWSSLGPLERWYESPPEQEPAAASAIARAAVSSAGINPLESEFLALSWNENETYSTLYGSSPASSFGTSDSSNRSSAASIQSGHSVRTDPLLRSRTIRKRRTYRHRRVQKTLLTDAFLPFQCTFCTETFKTKHDWQRHEQSLHLPLEQWICAPNGPTVMKENEMCCVFCSQVDPDEDHMATHNFAACHQRGIEERTFHRKDHLNQHLQLVHSVKYERSSMDSWKMAIPDIRSRCGFCELRMETWEERAGHLAGHFKEGKTMKDWQGDLGFDDEVQRMVENSIPPNFIDYERYTPAPYAASKTPVGSPVNAYELLQLELLLFAQHHFDTKGQMPNNNNMQLEACRIIFASDVSTGLQKVQPSWLRDLIMSSEDITEQARFGPLRLRNENWLSTLKINGKDNLFEDCPLEAQLSAFCKVEEVFGVAVRNEKIQEEACKIIASMEKTSVVSSDTFANWLIKLIFTSTSWLACFRQRVGLLRSEDVFSGATTTRGPTHVDNSDTERIIPLVGTETFSPIIDNAPYGLGPGSAPLSSLAAPELIESSIAVTSHFRPYMNNDNFHAWLVRDLTRWVMATMSPNNPDCHIPSDEEMQRQARFLMYGDDDPWSQTAADNAFWLQNFKRNVGIPDAPACTVSQ